MNMITFSTLACPHWQIETVITKAAEYGYDGIEWRGGSQGHVQPDMPAAKRSFIRERCSHAGLSSIAVTAYTGFVSDSVKERKLNLDELKRYVELAAELGAAHVRTFLGELPEGRKPTSTIYANILDCLNSASKYAASAGVKIAIEPHDDFVRSATITPILSQNTSHPALCVIWDLGNTFAAGEAPAAGFDLLKDHIGYVQVKDGKGRSPNWQLCALGQGDVPLAEAFELLRTNGYQGAFSVEWEYAWHSELDPPEIALPSALRTMRELLSAAQRESA